jgi:hypothetical protein
MSDLKEMLERRISANKSELEKWKTKLDQNPAYAFEWSDPAFKTAAFLEVQSSALLLVVDGVSIDDLIDVLTDRVLFRSSCPAMSTSVPSNLLEQYKLAAVADLLKHLNARKRIQSDREGTLK